MIAAFFRSRSLQTKLVTVITTAVLVISLFIVVTAIVATLAAYREHASDESAALVGLLGQDLVRLVAHETLEANADLTTRLQQFAEISRLELVDNHGVTRYGYQGPSLVLTNLLGLGTDYTNAVPVTYLNNTYGTATITMSSPDADEMVNNLLLGAASIIGLAILLSIVIARFLQRTISRPIFTLVDAIHEITVDEDYTLQLPDGGKDEIGLLYRDLQQLLDKLQAHRLQQENQREILADEVRHRTLELEQHLAELRAFNYAIAHDIRQPLRAIISFSNILREENAEHLDADALDLLQRIGSGGKRLAEMVDDLLLLSRVNEAAIQRTRFDLGELVADLGRELRRVEPERDIRLTIDTGLFINADRGLMTVAMQNLLQNAWKFTRYAKTPEITFRQREQDGEAVFEMTDNGAGYDERYASKLFQPFQRLHDAKEFEGTGIGLATVHRVIERHDGRIWSSSEPGKGAKFFFALN